MPVTVQILPDYNLVYVRFWGVLRVEETAAALAAFARNPQCRPGQRHLVDLTRLTDIERNYPKLMELEASKVEMLAGTGVETFMVYLANTPIGRRATNMGRNGWPPECGVVAIGLENEDDALFALGLPFRSIADMLAHSTAINT